MDENKKNVSGDDKASVTETAGSWWSGILGEFKRIAWPNRSQLVRMTIAAIITSGIVGAIIVGYDFALNYIYGLLADLFN